MNHWAWCIAALIASGLPVVGPRAQTPTGPVPPTVPRDTFDAWMSRLSNAGRCAAADELGTLNLITPAKRRATARGVRDGVTVSMARVVVAGRDSSALFPFRLRAYSRRFDSTTVAAFDSLSVLVHGLDRTHLDALTHIAYHGRFYNGILLEQLAPEGAGRLGAAAGERFSGVHPSLAGWLRDRGVAALGSDSGNEPEPSAVGGLYLPLHAIVVAAMGMPMLDNLDLEEVAREAAARGRPTFLFVAAPARIRGATGTLINPLAVF